MSYLQFDVSLPTHGDVAAHVSVLLVALQEVVLRDEDLPQPLQDVGVVENLVLNQLLRDGKENL